MNINNENQDHLKLPMGQSLLCYESHSLSKGYLSVDRLLQNFDIHILEASPLAPGRLMVLANPSLKDLYEAFKCVKDILKDQLMESTCIEHIQKQTLLAFYGLVQVPLQDGLLVMETSSTVSAIKITHHLDAQQLVTPIEIRSSRSLAEKSLVYATFQKDSRLQIEKALNQDKQVLDFTVISPLHNYWQSLF